MIYILSIYWDAVSYAFLTGYEVQWKRSSESEYMSGTTVTTASFIQQVFDAGTYDVRVRVVGQNGRVGAFSEITEISVVT